MAKLFGPLHSISAGGKIGNSIIFQTHNTRPIVRQYFKPRNTQSPLQCDGRLVFACVAQAISAVDPDRPFLQDLLTLIPQYQTWPTFIHKYVTGRFGRGHAGVLAIHAQYSSFQSVFWDRVAEAIQFHDNVYPCATDGGRTLTAGASFVLLVDLAFHFKALHPHLFNRPVYDTLPETWLLQNVLDFKTDFTDRVPVF